MPFGRCGSVRFVERCSYSLASYTGYQGYVSRVMTLFPVLNPTCVLLIAGTASSPILRSGTVENLFEPVLNDQGTKSLDRFLTMDPFTPTTSTQWSPGGFALSSSDLPGRRKKGSGFCKCLRITSITHFSTSGRDRMGTYFLSHRPNGWGSNCFWNPNHASRRSGGI